MSHIVPVQAGPTPVARLDELTSHLDACISDPQLPIETKLVDDIELQVNESNTLPLTQLLLPRLLTLLKTHAADTRPLASLSARLLRPYDFPHLLGLAPAADLVQGLAADYAPLNALVLDVLHAAARRPDHVRLLARVDGLPAALARRWLAAPDVAVGDRATRLLGDLLETDCPRGSAGAQLTNGLGLGGPAADGLRSTRSTPRQGPRPPGHGALWRRLFDEGEEEGGDDAVAVGALVRGLKVGADDPPATGRQKSLAQGRVLRLLPRLAALDPAPVWGLVRFAALDMVDRSDRLMHLTLVDFFETLVGVMRMRTAHGDGGGDTSSAVGHLRELMAVAVRDDDVREAMRTLPDRTVEEEAEPLRGWLMEILPP